MKSICQLLFLLVLLNGNSFGQTNKINKKDKNGRKQGHWIYYGADRPETQFADTSKVEEGDYEDDRKTGVWIKYNKDGTIRATGEFHNNRPFDPKIQVDRPAQIVETSNCTFGAKSNLTPESKIEFTPPSVSNGHPYSYYIAPKYPTQSYFPMTYIGENIDSLFASFLSFVYPSPEDLQEIVKHIDSNFVSNRPITKNELSITFTHDRYWVPQPTIFGEDTMEYHSASAVILHNISLDTLLIGKDLKLSMWLQYFDGEQWQYTAPNPSYAFILPEMTGPIVLFPGEIVVTAVPLFEGENRKLRIIIGDCVSEEFKIVDNQRKPKY